MIRSRYTSDRSGCGERMESGGFGRRADERRVQLNALIRRDVRIPKGSGGWRRRKSGRSETLQRARSVEAAGIRGEPVLVAEQKGRTGSETGWLGSEVAGQEL
jgi:hypothetical protein